MQKILALIVLIAATALASPVLEKESQCPQICTQEFKPVCAYDGEKYVQFSNDCLRKSRACKNNLILQTVELSACLSSSVNGGVKKNELKVESECPKMCTQEFKPVCVYDGEKYVQFSNDCLRKSRACKNNLTLQTVELSACLSSSVNGGVKKNELKVESECPKMCTQEFKPVCAKDGEKYVQFGNPCLKSLNECNNKRTLELVDTAFCSTEFVEDISEYLRNVDMQNTKCNISCPKNLAPVCISNGKIRTTMSNQCVAESFSCLVASQDAESAFTIIHEDSC